MTKTIFGKKLLMIATMTVLVTGLMFAATLDDAEAKKDKTKTGTHDLKCKSKLGSWFNPDITGDVYSSSEGKCNAGLGKVTSGAITAVTGVDAAGCIELVSTILPSYSTGKKGFIEYTTISAQCLFDENGLAIDLNVTPDPMWCQVGGAHTSTVTGTYEITDGLVKGTPVVGGSGTFVSEANHCDDEAANGNSFTTKLEGTIVFP